MLGVGWTLIGLLLCIALLVLIFRGLHSPVRRRRREQWTGPYLISQAVVAQKAVQTRKQLEFLAKTDSAMNPERLLQKVRSMLSDIQKYWEGSENKPRDNAIYESIFFEGVSDIQFDLGDRRNRHYQALIINWIEIVHFRYPRDSYEEERTFTALIEARFPDSLVRYPDSSFPADSPATFQEFWTFLWKEEDWSLWGTELPLESNALTEENVVELSSPDQFPKDTAKG